MLLMNQVLPAQDAERLATAIDEARSSWLTYAPYLDYFRARLRRGIAVAPEEIPGDVVTMNSRFTLVDHTTGASKVFTLVYPNEEDLVNGRISVLSPMGIAVFGARVGAEICWTSTNGPESAFLKELLYQPEAARDYHL